MKSDQTFVKIDSLILPFFPIFCETAFPKGIHKVPGKKDAEMYSEHTQKFENLRWRAFWKNS